MTAQVPTRTLPRSTAFERERPWRVWGVALVIACVANAGVVALLAHMSRLQALPQIEAPALHALRVLPPPPPPPPETPAPAQEEPAVPTLALSLPSLDLPQVPSDASLALPALGSLDGELQLPLTMPAFAATSATAGAGDQPLASAPPAYDTPAEREGAFDLERFYPRAARARQITGSTRVRITISAQGVVEQVQVLESAPAQVFDEAAMRLMHSLHFRPAMAGTHPVASVQDTLISWTIK